MEKRQADRLSILYLGDQDDGPVVAGAPGHQDVTVSGHPVLGSPQRWVPVGPRRDPSGHTSPVDNGHRGRRTVQSVHPVPGEADHVGHRRIEGHQHSQCSVAERITGGAGV